MRIIVLIVTIILIGLLSYQFRYERMSENTIFDRWQQRICLISSRGIYCPEPKKEIGYDEAFGQLSTRDRNGEAIGVIVGAFLAFIIWLIRHRKFIYSWICMRLSLSGTQSIISNFGTMPGFGQFLTSYWLGSIILRILRKKVVRGSIHLPD